MHRSIEPLWWLLFAIGGTLAAFLTPIHILIGGIGLAAGWARDAFAYDHIRGLVSHPLARLYLFALISLSLLHWAHRFRYTLYDGLQLKHLTALIAVLCYGAAVLGTAVSAYLLWTIP